MHPAWKPRGPEWATLAPGVKWLIRPMTAEVQAVVSARVSRAIGSLQESRAILEDMGFDPEEMGELGNLDVMAGFSVFLGGVYAAEALLDAWHGIEDEDGQPIAVTPEAIRAALRFGPPEGGSALLQPFMAWLDRPRMPIAADQRRLRELAKWEHLGGMEHCRGCDLVGAECANGGTDGGDRCPRAVNAPQTVPGIAALAASRHSGAWKRSEGLSGGLIGLDYAACLAIAEAAGAAGHTAEVVRCLAAIEAGALEAAVEKAKRES